MNTPPHTHTHTHIRHGTHMCVPYTPDAPFTYRGTHSPPLPHTPDEPFNLNEWHPHTTLRLPHPISQFPSSPQKSPTHRDLQSCPMCNQVEAISPTEYTSVHCARKNILPN